MRRTLVTLYGVSRCRYLDFVDMLLSFLGGVHGDKCSGERYENKRKPTLVRGSVPTVSEIWNVLRTHNSVSSPAPFSAFFVYESPL